MRRKKYSQMSRCVHPAPQAAGRGCSIRSWGAVEAWFFSCDVLEAGQASIHGYDVREAIGQDQFGWYGDVLRAEGLASAQMAHREGQRRFGHKVQHMAQVRGHAGCGFATLLGADAAEDEFFHPAPAQPHIELRISEDVAHRFLKRVAGWFGNQNMVRSGLVLLRAGRG